MTSVHETGGSNEGEPHKFDARLLPGQSLITNEFAAKYERGRRGAKLYVIHPSSTQVSLDREGMVFPAYLLGEEVGGFVISRVSGLTGVRRVYIGDADFDFETLFQGDEKQGLNLTLTSPGFIGHVVDENDTSYFKLRQEYAERFGSISANPSI